VRYEVVEMAQLLSEAGKRTEEKMEKLNL